MYKSKKYSYEYEQIDEEEKSCETIVGDILADPEFANLEEVVICHKERISLADGVAVGNGKEDIPMLELFPVKRIKIQLHKLLIEHIM